MRAFEKMLEADKDKMPLDILHSFLKTHGKYILVRLSPEKYGCLTHFKVTPVRSREKLFALFAAVRRGTAQPHDCMDSQGTASRTEESAQNNMH